MTVKKDKKRKNNEEEEEEEKEEEEEERRKTTKQDEEKERQRLQRNKLHLQKVINQKEKSSQSNAQMNNSNGNALPSHRRWQILQKPSKVTRRTSENKGQGMDVEPWDKISRDSLFPSGTKPNTNPARPSGFWYEMLRQRTRSLVNQHLWINEIFTSKHLCLSFSLRQLLIFFFFFFFFLFFFKGAWKKVAFSLKVSVSSFSCSSQLRKFSYTSYLASSSSAALHNYDRKPLI